MRVPATALCLTAALAASGPAGSEPVRASATLHLFSLRPGDRVRVWAAPVAGASLSAAVGTVTAGDEDGLVVLVDERAVVVPFQSLTRLEVTRDRSQVRRGALIGLALGALLAPFLDLELVDTGHSTRDHILEGALFAAVGAGVGAWVGSELRSERWQPVTLDPVRRGSLPGARLSLSLRF